MLLLLGAALLLVLPAIFVAILALTEAPDQWVATVRNGYRLPQALAGHWLWRYVHTLGAAIVFGAAYHFLASKPEDAKKKRSLLTWMAGGLVVQVIFGVLLYVTLPKALDAIMYIPFVIGVLAALMLLRLLFARAGQSTGLNAMSLSVLLIAILLPMLATRQLIQLRAVVPVQEQVQASAQKYDRQLQGLTPQSLATYTIDLHRVYDNGPTIYTYSCGFCHNETGGQPPVASSQLAIPPEWLSQVRAQRGYLQRVLADGVPGSAMPYFTVFTKDRLDDVITYLDEQYQVLSAPGPMPQAVLEAAMQRATATYAGTCASCHGADGKDMTAVSKGLTPPPPDFTAYNLTPERTFEVITNGYPGTAMAAFKQLPEDERWGLVAVVNGFFGK